jgi:cytochrome P450
MRPNPRFMVKSTLGQTLTIFSTRTMQVDTIFGGKKLRKGRNLLIPYRAMHFDNTVFGTDTASSNPRRFLEVETLVTNKNNRPFGGAAHFCPGRYIARREVHKFIAVMLNRFDISLAEDKSKGQKSVSTKGLKPHSYRGISKCP